MNPPDKVMMGFEENKRVVKIMKNQSVEDVFNGRVCYFRSKLEHRWAKYLQILLESGQIAGWFYEPDKFIFPDEITAPVQYTPDFKVIENDGTVIYQETKGYHDGQTNTKLRRMAKHYPDTIFELVLQRIPKKGKGAARQRIAAKYTRRIIDASKIFRQIGVYSQG